MESINQYGQLGWDLLVQYGPGIVGALITLILGWWVIAGIRGFVRKSLEKREVDVAIRSFSVSLLDAALKIMLILTALGMVGVEMTSFLAIVGAAGLAVGLALKDSLANFAGGIMILLLKPFRVGDFIDAQGHQGTVTQIVLFHTVLNTPDKKQIIVPNGPLSVGSIMNVSAEENRRVDWSIGIAYGDDYDKAKEILLKWAAEDDRILSDPEPFVGLGALADSSVNVTVRFWVKAPDYWDVHFHYNEKIYKEFPKNGLNFPFPQMDVHLDKVD